jgi:hypothetical protein
MRVRFKRAWRGYRAGDEISPPAALREELLRKTTPLGEPVAELVDVPADAGAVEASVGEAQVQAPPEETRGLLDALMPKGKRGNAKKGKE